MPFSSNKRKMLLKREQALQKINYTHALLTLYQREKEAVDTIIDQALNFPPDGNTWQAYEALKKQVRAIDLHTADEYTVMMDFIDYLLPENTTEEELLLQQQQSKNWTEDETEYYEQQIDDQLDNWYEHATLIANQLATKQHLPANPVVLEAQDTPASLPSGEKQDGQESTPDATPQERSESEDTQDWLAG